MTTRFVSVLAACVAALSIAAVTQQRSDSTTLDLKKMKETLARLEAPAFLAAEQLPISNALKLLEGSGRVKFIWDDGSLPDESVSVLADQAPLGEVLKKVLDECHWTFAVQPDGRILLRPAPRNPQTLTEK